MCVVVLTFFTFADVRCRNESYMRARCVEIQHELEHGLEDRDKEVETLCKHFPGAMFIGVPGFGNCSFLASEVVHFINTGGSLFGLMDKTIEEADESIKEMRLEACISELSDWWAHNSDNYVWLNIDQLRLAWIHFAKSPLQISAPYLPVTRDHGVKWTSELIDLSPASPQIDTPSPFSPATTRLLDRVSGDLDHTVVREINFGGDNHDHRSDRLPSLGSPVAHTEVRARARRHTGTHVCAYTHTHTHTRTHARTHTHTHTHMCC